MGSFSPSLPRLRLRLLLALVGFAWIAAFGCITIIDFNRCEADEDCLPRQACRQKTCVFGEREKASVEKTTEAATEPLPPQEGTRPEEASRPDRPEAGPEEPAIMESRPEPPPESLPEPAPEPTPENQPEPLPDLPLQRLACTSTQTIIFAPADPLYTLVSAEQGKRLFSLDAKGLLYRWDVQTKQVTDQFRFTSTSKFSPLAASTDGTLLISASSSRVAQILHFQPGKGIQPLRNLPSVRSDIRQIQIHPQAGLFGIAYSNRVDLWTLSYTPPTLVPPILLTSVVLDQNDILHFQFSDDGKFLSVMDSKKVEVWEIRPPLNPGGPPQVAPLWTWTASRLISHSAFHPKSQMIAVAGLDSITLLSLQDPTKTHEIAFPTLVYQVFYEPQNGLLFASHGDKGGYLLDSLQTSLAPGGTPTSSRLQSIRSQTRTRSMIPLPSQRSTFLATDDEGDTLEWLAPPGSPAVASSFFLPARSWLSLPSVPGFLAIGHQSGEISLFQGAKKLQTLPFGSSPIVGLAASSDKKLLVAATSSGLRSYEANDISVGPLRESARAGIPLVGAVHLSLSSKGDLLALSVEGESEVRLYNPQTTSFSFLGVLRGARQPVSALRFHPTKPLLLIGSQDQALFLWDLQREADGTLRSNLLLQRDNAHQAAISDLSWHPSEDVFASTSLDRFAKFWRLILVPAPALAEIRTPLSASPNAFQKALFLPSPLASGGDVLFARQTIGLNQTPITHLEIKGTTKILAGPASPILFFSSSSSLPYEIWAGAFGDLLLLTCR